MNLEMLKRMMIKLLQEPEPKPRQVSVVDLTVCVGQRTVHECLNVALVNTSVDRACSARSVGRSIGLELAWCLKTNTAFPPLQRHLGPPCLRPPLADPSQILRRSSRCLCLLPVLRILPFPFSLLFFQLSPFHSSISPFSRPDLDCRARLSFAFLLHLPPPCIFFLFSPSWLGGWGFSLLRPQQFIPIKLDNLSYVN